MSIFFGKKESKQEEAIGFEPEEQKTPWLGRILLIILAIILLYFGWRGLEDLGRIPNRPEVLSQCSGAYSYEREGRLGYVQNYQGSYIQYDYRNYPYGPKEATPYAVQESALYVAQEPTPNILMECAFSSYEKQASVPDSYQIAQAAWKDMDDFSRVIIQPLQTQLTNIDSQLVQKQREYDLSLQEVQAGRPPVGKTTEQLMGELQVLQAQKQQISQQLSQAQANLKNKENLLKEKEAVLVNKINQAIDFYNKAWAGYKFWVFLLEMLFVLPSFALFLWFYFRLLRKNSPHTVILLPIVFVGGVLFARSLIIYFWASFLANLITWLLKLTEALILLRTLLYYFGMLLAILIFGGAVYLLQRKIYAPARVRLRRLKSNKCPSCEAPMDFAKNFCAACGKPVTGKCPSCGQDKFMDFKHCPYCGK